MRNNMFNPLNLEYVEVLRRGFPVGNIKIVDVDTRTFKEKICDFFKGRKDKGYLKKKVYDDLFCNYTEIEDFIKNKEEHPYCQIVDGDVVYRPVVKLRFRSGHEHEKHFDTYDEAKEYFEKMKEEMLDEYNVKFYKYNS